MPVCFVAVVQFAVRLPRLSKTRTPDTLSNPTIEPKANAAPLPLKAYGPATVLVVQDVCALPPPDNA